RSERLAAAEARSEQLAHELDDVRAELHLKLGEADGRLHELSAELDAARERVGSLDAALDATRGENERGQERLRLAELAAKDTTEFSELMAAEVAATKDALAEATAARDQLQLEALQSSAASSEFRAALDEAKAQLAGVEAELGRL